MQKIKYQMIAESPLYTGSDNNLGIKSEIRKQRVVMTKPITINSRFKTEQDRENALVNVMTILYNHISSDYRMSRGRDIWGEFKSRLLSAAGGKDKKSFLTRYAKYFKVDAFDTKLFGLLNAFDDHELLYFIRDQIDFLILRMRYNRENANEVYSKIKELNNKAEKLKEKLLPQSDQIELIKDERQEQVKAEITSIYDQIRELEKQTRFEDVEIDQSSELTYRKEFHDVPYFTGNSIAGIIRRLMMEDYFNKIGVTSTYDFAYHTLFTGGVLKIDLKDTVMQGAANILSVSLEKLKTSAKELSGNITGKAGEVDLDQIDEMTYICPPLRLFGAAIGNNMIESEMSVSNADLICIENNNGDTSMWGLLEDVFYTRHDSSKKERDIEIVETSGEPHQMKYIMETIIKGAKFKHSFICKSDNELVKAAFYAALRLFVLYPRIGGKSSRGLGCVDLSQLEEQIDETYVKMYYEHLEANKEKMKKYFSAEIVSEQGKIFDEEE